MQLNLLTFQESTFYILFFSIFFLLVFILVIFLIGFYQERSDHQLAIQQRLNLSLIYRMSMKENKVEEFDIRRKNYHKTYVLDDFVKLFSPSDHASLMMWLTQLTKKSRDVAWTFQTHLFKDKRQFQQVIFEVNHIHTETEVIHLRRYVLRYLKPNAKKRRSIRYALTTEEAIRVTKKMNKNEGALFYISFNFGRSSLDDQFKAFYLSQFKERLLPYLSPQLQIIDTLNDLYVLSTKRLERQQYIAIAQTFIRMIAQYLEVNSLESLVKFTVAIVEHHYFPNDLKALIRKAREMHAYMFSKSMNFLVYDPVQPLTSAQDAAMEQKQKELFAKFNFSIQFRSLIDLSTIQPTSQLISIVPRDDLFMSTLDILQAAHNTNDARGFFNQYMKKLQEFHTTTTFKGMIPLSIQMPIVNLMKEYDVLSTPYRHQYYIDELEMKEADLQDTQLTPLLRLFHQNHLSIGLALDDAKFDLEDAVYAQFDFFVLDHRHVQSIESDEKSRLQFKRILQQFAVFNKPFYVWDLHSESAFELLPLNRVKIVGADVIQPWQESPSDPSLKMMSKMRQWLIKQEKIYGKTN